MVNRLRKVIKTFLDRFSEEYLKEDARKVGVNLFTAGVIGLVLTKDMRLGVILPTIWLIWLGMMCIFIGTRRGVTK